MDSNSLKDEIENKNLSKVMDYEEKIIFSGSAYLRDFTYLPCVIFKDSQTYLDLAIKRFSETMKNSGDIGLNTFQNHRSVVSSFLFSGNRIWPHDVVRVEVSPFSMTQEQMMAMKGETAMGWSEFTVIMSDGATFLFGASFDRFFFNFPPGYSARDIKEIIPTERGKAKRKPGCELYTDRPFFICYY